MKIKLLLRIAAILMLLHLFGHLFGHLTWKQTNNPAKQIVINQMTQHAFPFMGTVRSVAEYYDGYGYIAGLAMLLFVFLLWILSGNKGKQYADISIKILTVITVFLFALGVDELLFFFPFAAGFSLLAGILSTYALVLIHKQSPQK